MAWSASSMFRAWPQMLLNLSGTSYTGLDSDTIKAALYDNDITPDNDAAVGSTGYDTGVWASTGNEVSDDPNWDLAGEPLTSKSIDVSTADVVMFDAANTPQSGATCTLSNAFGCLVYDDTISGGSVAKQGVTYHYFGGGQSVTAGTFTIVWHTNGLFRITCTAA